MTVRDLGMPSGNLSRLRGPYPGCEVMGLGQDFFESFRKKLSESALVLIVAGLLAGYVGGSVLETSPFGPVVATAGGFLLAAGVLPFILGI